MSVNKSKRSESKSTFIADARNLMIEVFEITKKFPKSYYTLTNKISELSYTAYNEVTAVNTIFLSNKTSEMEYEWREKHIHDSIVAIDGLQKSLTILYELVSKGTNFLGDKQSYSKKFQKVTETAQKLEKEMKSLQNSDKKKWESYHSKSVDQP